MEKPLRYIVRRGCPLCGRAGESAERLRLTTYRFAGSSFEQPPGGVHVVRCSSCGLAYKREVPDPEDLSGIFDSLSPNVWISEVDYPNERALAFRFARPPVDCLDVGAGDGGMLSALAAAGGRLSALDVSQRAAPANGGEFIKGLLDSADLHWSRRPYGLVTAFDVMEHLYDPRLALENLRDLVAPGGHLIVETGNLGAIRESPARWWYLNLLEHHLAWTDEGLVRALEWHGFVLEERILGPHKGRRYASPLRRAGAACIRALRPSDTLSEAAWRLLRLDPRVNGGSSGGDHQTLVLQRKPDAP